MSDASPRNARYYPPIGDYALIGDCHTAALVSRDGSIDWYCPFRFDAPAVFCRLLDAERGGYLQVSPSGRFRAERAYRGPTNVLATTFTASDGAVRVTDFMPVHARPAGRRGYDVGASHQVLRLVEGLSGDVSLTLEFKPTFEYATAGPRLTVARAKGCVASAGQTYLTLAGPGLDLSVSPDGRAEAHFRVQAGQRQWLALTASGDEQAAHHALALGAWDKRLAQTLDYWERWAASCTFRGPYRDQVLRSALALKLLTYEPTGAIVAAPTTSLPEEVGGTRNWDYRYTWLRDSSMILYALMTVGYENEAADFIHWLERTLDADSSTAPQIMYRIDGGRELAERPLPHLDGYRGSRPVRVGNRAAGQRQLDVLGESLIAAYFHHRQGGDARGEGRTAAAGQPSGPSPKGWALLRALVTRAAEHWDEAGRGIWEVRGGARPFLYGKLMCWAALDRGIRLAAEHELDAPLGRWRRTREEIKHAILTRGYSAERQAFTQAFGSTVLDATALAIPRLGLLPPTDPRVRSTVARIREELTRDGLVYRYRTRDGLAGGEGTFTLCTFWLVDALALGGHLAEAHDLFANVLSYANDIGLLSEEIDPVSRELLGNFPQGFSHLGLIGAAVNLAKASRHGPEAQPQNEAERAGPARHAAAAGYSARDGESPDGPPTAGVTAEAARESSAVQGHRTTARHDS